MTVVYQFYCGIYLGFLLIIPVTLILFSIFISQYQSFLKNIKRIHWTLKMLISPLISVLAILPLMLPYFKRSELLNEVKTYDGIVASIPTIRSYLYVHNDGNSIWNFLSRTGEDYPAFYDHQIFSSQYYGGISRYFEYLMRGVDKSNELDYKLGVLKSKNYYIRNEKQPLNHGIFNALFISFFHSNLWCVESCSSSGMKIQAEICNGKDLFNELIGEPAG